MTPRSGPVSSLACGSLLDWVGSSSISRPLTNWMLNLLLQFAIKCFILALSGFIPAEINLPGVAAVSAFFVAGHKNLHDCVPAKSVVHSWGRRKIDFLSFCEAFIHARRLIVPAAGRFYFSMLRTVQKSATIEKRRRNGTCKAFHERPSYFSFGQTNRAENPLAAYS